MNQDALKTLKSIRLVTLATINEDGSPRATPLLADYAGGRINWRSSEEAVHSRNIARDPRVYISAWHEDDEENEFKAVYVASHAVNNGNTKVVTSEYRGDTTTEYYAAVGELDEAESLPNRYYFRSTEKSA